MIVSPTSLPVLLALASTTMMDLSSAAAADLPSSHMGSLHADVDMGRYLVHLPPMHDEAAEEDEALRSFNASWGEPSLDEAWGYEHEHAHVDETAAMPAHEEGTKESRGAMDLPAELAALIANAARQQIEANADTETKAGVRYYATYTEGESCSSKPSSSFELWEESHATIEDCCDVHFSWEYDACVGR